MGKCMKKETLEYIRLLGLVNCRLAKMASEVVEVVYGIPVMKKRSRSVIMKWLESCLIAISMYSKIPVPQVEWTKEKMSHAMCFSAGRCYRRMPFRALALYCSAV